VIKGRLPLRLAFEATIARVVPPRELELRAEGELAGTGRWLLDQQGEITTVRYLWDVRTTKPWMNLTAPIARPLFTWNSKGVMLEAGQGLARFLGCGWWAPSSPPRRGQRPGRCAGWSWRARWRGWFAAGDGRFDSTGDATSPRERGSGLDSCCSTGTSRQAGKVRHPVNSPQLMGATG
jgi:hypothetical protein